MAPGADRNALLSSIQKGAKLKKTVTNDRSAPIVGKPTANGNENTPSAAARSSGDGSAAGAGPSTGGPAMGLGGLFAGGMPKLRSTGSRLIASNDDNKGNSSLPPRPSAPSSKSEEGIGGGGVKTNILKATVATGRAPPPPPPTSSGPSVSSPPLPRVSASPEKRTPGPNFSARTAPISSTIANSVNTGKKRDGSPERRATAPTAHPLLSIGGGQRPPLPSRPAGITSRVRELQLHANDDGEKGASAKPRHSSAIEVSHKTSPTIKANWRFPAEGNIPRPNVHSGRVFVYPSGRERGTYINEIAADRDYANDDDDGLVRPSLRQQPSQTSAQRPQIQLPSMHPSIVAIDGHRNSEPSVKAASKINKGGPATANAEGAIQDKLGKLETQLEEAISQQDFETCLALKPRITKLKDMLELSQRGLAIDEAKINAV